jgi:ArsR family transcriptional regulator, arsenate/arsenite/antimonite-responsive transcriptional repressor
LVETAKRLKALADVTRLQMLFMIAQFKECCVCEIQEMLDLTAPTTSRNLRILEESDFVAKRRVGKWMYYRLSEMPGNWDQLRSAVLNSENESQETHGLLSRIKTWQENSCCGILGKPVTRQKS